MLERRRLVRKHLTFYLDAFDGNTDQIVGHLVDMTTEGVMLLCEDAIEVNATFRLRVELPEEISGRKQISFDARSVRCNEDINPGLYNAGFQLQDLNLEDIEAIEALIEKYEFKD